MERAAGAPRAVALHRQPETAGHYLCQRDDRLGPLDHRRPSATFGTGDYPINHGIPGNQMRDPEGANVDTWLQNADPRFLEAPTISELWDEQNGNKPIVATVSYEGWHLGMIGHGAQRDGGDKDIAVLWEAEENEWWTNESYYELPSYLQETDLDRLERYEAKLDPRRAEGRHLVRAHSRRPSRRPREARHSGLRQVHGRRGARGHRARAIWQGRRHRPAVDRDEDARLRGPCLERHRARGGDVIFETDRQIARYKKALDDKLGKGNYLLVISADHGQQPLPELFGGWRINNKELERDIVDQFGIDILEKATPVDIYLEREVLDKEGIGLDEVARYLGTYTIGDNIPDGAPGADRVPDARLDELLFAGAFSTDYLQALSPEKIAGFGDGIYPEGDLTIGDEGE